ncbi:jouberin-like [Clytia hemisphaerica]|uniref:jouberin-like n=1 Tax=Clytia hemisphaerica TaxID=252671 RepID=UPI0034D414E5
MEEEISESSEALLVKKKTKEAKKVKAARQRTQARFETLLNVGSGSEEVSETAQPIRKSKKERVRSKTADSVAISKPSNSKKKQSRSLEDLVQDEDEQMKSSNLKEKARKKKKKAADDSTRKKRTKSEKSKSEEDGEENYAFEQSFNSVVDDHEKAPQSQQEDEDDDQELQTKSKTKKAKEKKRKRKASASERIMNAMEKKYQDDVLLLCLIVHRCDQLKPDIRIHHPVVRIHIVDMETGQYVKKRDKSRNVTSLLENENENIDYVLPMMTQPFDFKKRRTLTPAWEETIIYNERYSYFLQREQDSPPVVIFFELLDFMQMNLNSKEYSKTDKGWHRIAWAFLKLVSPTTGVTNTDKRLRLQLYQPVTKTRVKPSENSGIEIYQWWMYGSRVKYDSTFYVTVKGVQSPKGLKPTTRSTFPTQLERAGMTFEELNSTLETNAAQSDHETTSHIWTKLPGQVNRIPNHAELTIPTGRKGCSVVSFSQDGRYIALGCSTNEGFPVTVYEFPENKLICTFGNHFGIVYALTWSSNGKELLSASADTTVRCWDTKRFLSSAIKVFPHPSYVYACKYHPIQQNLVVTGSYDRTIRVWNKISDGLHAELLKEFTEHTGYVNALVFSLDGTMMFTGDSNGVINMWQTKAEKKKKDVSEQVNRWKLMRTVELEELKRVSINSLTLHPNQLKLLVHARDSILRMLDLRSDGILKTYVGGMNFKEYIRSTLSPCGSYVFCGAENGLVNVWNTETGQQVYTYKSLGYTQAVSDICFHPHDNFIAFCCYGNAYPVQVYSYKPSAKYATDEEPERTTTPIPKKVQESQRDLEETTELYKSLRTATIITDDTKRMERVNERLKSVTSPSTFLDDTTDLIGTKGRVTFKDPSPRSDYSLSPRQQDYQTMRSTWGSDFSTTKYDSTSKDQYGYSLDSNIVESSTRPVDRTMTMSQLDASRKADVKELVKAIYEYQPARSDELYIRPGDVITIMEKNDSDWWMGYIEADDRQGYFPSNYVEPYNHQRNGQI